MGKQFAVATGNGATTQAAVEVLKDGGNAIDAAVAAYWTACTAEPCMASAGAGGFALVHMARQRPVLVDFFCQTPRSVPDPAVDFRVKTVDFGDSTEDFYIGSGAIAVPGAVAGMFTLQQRFGSRPMSVLAQPGVAAARDGVVIDAFQAHDMYLLRDFLGDSEYGRRLLYRDGAIRGEGDVVQLPGWAAYLEYLSREDQRAFYEDEPARSLLRDHAGHLVHEDLSRYEVVLRPPLTLAFHGYHIFTNPFPSIGGMLLGVLLREMASWSADVWREPIAFLKQWDELCHRLHRSGYHLSTLSLLLNGLIPPGGVPAQKRGSTSHISVVDGVGNAISMTFSIGEGSGYFIPDTDIHMNNMLGEPSLLPDGLFSWTPDTRLSSMMAPTLVSSGDEQEWLVMGTGGAGRIPFVLGQAIAYYVAMGMPFVEAMTRPRVHRDRHALHLEAGWPEAVHEALYTAPINRWRQRSLFFGGIHAVRKQAGTLEAIGDDRRMGVGEAG
jgi:gamma-glutamyltranspeptidase/glutathione hydrolase